jgi:hypothetical protein
MISSNVTVEMGPLSPVPFWKNAALAAGALDSAAARHPDNDQCSSNESLFLHVE